MSKRLLKLRMWGLTGAFALCAALLLPMRSEAANQLRWRQDGGNVQGFRIYFGTTAGQWSGFRDIGYVSPGSDGVYSYPLAGLITSPAWISMTAYNDAGFSAYADAIFVNPICSTDADCAVPQQCKTGMCDLTLGCITQNVADGTACDDGDANTTGDHCSAGQCINTSPPGVGGTVDITQIVAGASSGTVGMPVTFLAVATSTGTPLFRWFVMPLSTGHWVQLRDYDANPMFVWTPQTAGTYRVAASSRTEGAAQEQDWHAIDFTIQAASAPAPSPTSTPTDPVQLNVEDPDPTDQVPARVPIRLEAMADPGLEYRFLVFSRGKPWLQLRAFSSDPSFVWLPTLRAGTYEIGVEVRRRGERSAFGYDTAMVQIVSAPLLECSKSGAMISCSTPASGGELEYQWFVAGPRTRWQLVQAYGTSESFSFTPNNGPGTYSVGVWAKPVAGSPLGARLVYSYAVRVSY